MGLAWTAFYWGDYTRATSHLSLAEHGAYILLLAHYYSTGAPLPANEVQLQRICRCTCRRDAEAMLTVLHCYFVRDGDLYRNPRADEELKRLEAISEKRRQSAKKSHAGR